MRNERGKIIAVVSAAWIAMSAGTAALAVSSETANGCSGNQDDPCVRSGSCEIQGSAWLQDVTIDRSDIFDTQGWPGLCDMVHVGLVQGDCEPSGSKTDVTVSLSDTTFAEIPEIVGPLSCAGDAEIPPVDLPLLPDFARILVWLGIALGGLRTLAKPTARRAVRRRFRAGGSEASG